MKRGLLDDSSCSCLNLCELKLIKVDVYAFGAFTGFPTGLNRFKDVNDPLREGQI